MYYKINILLEHLNWSIETPIKKFYTCAKTDAMQKRISKIVYLKEIKKIHSKCVSLFTDFFFIF